MSNQPENETITPQELREAMLADLTPISLLCQEERW